MGKRRFGRLLVFFLLVLGALIFLNSDFFHVKELEFVGMEGIVPGELVPKEDVMGFNIFHIDKKYLAEFALQDSTIKEVEIRREFPATLVYYLEAREPLAWVKTGSEFFLVDEEGYSIKKTEEIEELDLPLIKLEGEELKEEVRLDEENLAFCLNLLENLEKWVLERVTDVVLGQRRNVRLYLEGGGQILLGQAYTSDELPGLIMGFMRELEKDLDRLEYLDLRFEGRPVYKLK